MIIRYVAQNSVSEQIREMCRRWLAALPPCGIRHEDPYNPCLPERDEDGRLFCCTCGLRQRLAIR